VLKEQLWNIQQRTYELSDQELLDPIESNRILHLCEEVISHSYTSIISPFPFHNCYSIEDVKAFIDIVRMINPKAVVSVKVSPSVDIEFIATGLGRIARDNSLEALAQHKRQTGLSGAIADLDEYGRKYGMKIEIWLDGPRGGTGASPNIIKGQMGMHIEYAIPLIHDRLLKDGLRNFVKFFVSGGIRTYEDVIKTIALGADGVIWGTAPLVAIGCDRNRNCHDGCSRGIATSNLIMQNLRNVETNSRQIINAFSMMQMQVIKALAGLGCRDIRELRGRFDKIHWLGLKERVDFRRRQQREYQKINQDLEKTHATGQSNCGVAAVIGTENIPSYILDQALHSMKNRGMDGVGVGKTLCFPEYPDHYAYSLMVKGILQTEMEQRLSGDEDCSSDSADLRTRARKELLSYRQNLAETIRQVFLEPCFEFANDTKPHEIRESYKRNSDGSERDYREFGNSNTDPGDIFRFFVRVKKQILHDFIEKQLLTSSRYTYIREYFPEVNSNNYHNRTDFLSKAEDLFVFDHSVLLSQILYVWQVETHRWAEYLQQKPGTQPDFPIENGQNPLAPEQLETHGRIYLEQLRDFTLQFRQTAYKKFYQPREHKIATVMSTGKNFGIWKTAGREIPWETPAAPNNIIHVRLATGSVVEQMNAHPFAKLHTALTHNGETTNYETLKQRVEQFGLPPLATTDTEVASLKFHLLAEELEYPDWALFESFSPTTGDDLKLIDEEIRPLLEEVQRVEFTSSPDGPYQYLCLRHVPDAKVTERVDLKDPADLRPSTTAFWQDTTTSNPRCFSLIASEEQAIWQALALLDKEGLIDGAAPDSLLVSDGMISRYHYDENSKVKKVEFLDRYGKAIKLPDFGTHYSYLRSSLQEPLKSSELIEDLAQGTDKRAWLRKHLANWDFNTFRWVLEHITDQTTPENSQDTIVFLTWIIDYLRVLDTGTKAKSSLIDISRQVLFNLLDRIEKTDPEKFSHTSQGQNALPPIGVNEVKTLLIDATGFTPEGTDPAFSLASCLAKAYHLGWRHFLLYRVNGQRLISTAVMQSQQTQDVIIDIYGTPGEYLGAFMQGGLIRVHANSQNFTAMGIHHGEIQVFGNAGKVCGYASKGGKVTILGDINDRAWTNSVNDARCQSLEVNIFGTASKYAGESLMGGNFLFMGLCFTPDGEINLQPRPYRGTKLLGGASRGRFLFFDPLKKLDTAQYVQGKEEEINSSEWVYWQERVLELLKLAGVSTNKTGGSYILSIKKESYSITPANFTLIVPKGGLKGYESH